NEIYLHQHVSKIRICGPVRTVRMGTHGVNKKNPAPFKKGQEGFKTVLLYNHQPGKIRLWSP
ncbi:MAG: hypothetical protein MI799_05755, partial [Desulfobacterales bacterium]|nr:hypothetical protein [Desulfobacterales bacterium]